MKILIKQTRDKKDTGFIIEWTEWIRTKLPYEPKADAVLESLKKTGYYYDRNTKLSYEIY